MRNLKFFCAFLALLLLVSCTNQTSSSFFSEPHTSITETIKAPPQIHVQMKQEETVKLGEYSEVKISFFPTGLKFARLTNAVGDNLYYDLASIDYLNDSGFARYNIKTGAGLLLGRYDFGYAGDYELYLDDRYIFFSPIESSKNGSGNMEVKLLMFDAENPGCREVYRAPTSVIFNNIVRINKEEILLFHSGLEVFENGETKPAPSIVKFNFVTGELKEIYKHRMKQDEVVSKNHSKMPWWITADTDGRIFVLLVGFDNGKLTTYIQEIDDEGNELNLQQLNCLADYGDIPANTIMAQNGYFFLYYYATLEGSATTYAILKETEKGLVRMLFNGQSPVGLVSKNLVRGKYLICDITPDNEDYKIRHYTHHFFIMDLESGSYRYIDLPDNLREELSAMHVGSVVNENGDLFIYGLDTTKINDPKILRFDGDSIFG